MTRRTTEITEQDMFNALDWLRDNAEELGTVRGYRAWMEELRKITKAELMAEALESGITASNAQETYAYRHPRYREVAKDMADAVRLEAKMFALKEAAAVKIASFQTISANRRIEAKNV